MKRVGYRVTTNKHTCVGSERECIGGNGGKKMWSRADIRVCDTTSVTFASEIRSHSSNEACNHEACKARLRGRFSPGIAWTRCTPCSTWLEHAQQVAIGRERLAWRAGGGELRCCPSTMSSKSVGYEKHGGIGGICGRNASMRVWEIDADKLKEDVRLRAGNGRVLFHGHV